MTTTGNRKASECGTGLHGALAKVSNRDVLIAPSLLAADFARLSSEVTDVSAAGAEVLHLDITVKSPKLKSPLVYTLQYRLQE